MQEKLFKRKDGIYRKGKMLTFAFLCLLSQVGWAQQIVVKGTVTDQNGTPLLGVNVIQKSTSNGTATDFDGNYQITAPQDAVLVFSFLGFETQEVTTLSFSAI